MIDVICHTNLDLGPTKNWPKQMVVRPMVGDYVESNCGRLRLKVVAVTHGTKKGSYRDLDKEREINLPVLNVELNR